MTEFEVFTAADGERGLRPKSTPLTRTQIQLLRGMSRRLRTLREEIDEIQEDIYALLVDGSEASDSDTNDPAEKRGLGAEADT